MSEGSETVSDAAAIHAYVSGALSEAEAEAFEQRVFADDRLAAELQRALEIRAATAGTAAPGRRAGKVNRVLVPLAVAAGAAALAIGLYRLQLPAEPEPVFRGAEEGIALRIEVAGGRLEAAWTAVPGAAGYELRIFGTDGRLIRSLRSDAPSAATDLPSGAGRDAPPQPAFADVVALDDFGQTLVRSRRIDIPD